MHMGLVSTFAMKSFLDLSEKGRLLVEKYFNLSSHLYFDFTHLVCRSAVEGICYYKALPSWVGMYCKACQKPVCLFVCLSDFSGVRTCISISFCRHLERCQVRFEFAFQQYWITNIEMRRFLDIKIIMEHL
jgi:hypothetical protein